MAVDVTDLEKFGDEVVDLHHEPFEVQLPKSGYVYGTQVQALARRLVPVDLGALKLSITPVVRQQVGGAIIVEVGPTQKYGQGIEFGRPPHYVSPAQLAGWAKRRRVNPYAVSKAIEKRGTKAQPYMLPAFEQMEPQRDKFILAAISEAIKAVFKNRV